MKIILSAIVIVVMAALPVRGNTILIQQPEVVVKKAPLIVEAIVENIKFNSISNLTVGEAWITLKVVDRIVGDSPSKILIYRFNVTPDLKFVDEEWDPSFSNGEHFIICLLPTIENNFVKGTQIHIDEFKKQIIEIREGKKNNFPSELPRQTVNEIKSSLKKLGQNYKIMSKISHLNSEFVTFNFT